MSILRNLDLNLLKVFDAIYTARSVSGAARRMGMSQPSISRGLGRLRDHFGDPLFERSGNGVVPTQKAEAILVSVQSALALIESTIDDTGFDPATDKRHFRMILPDFVETLVMPGLLNRLPQASRLTFEALAYSDTENFRTAITDGDVDIGIVPFLPDEIDLTYHHILRDHFVLIARSGHPVLRDGFTWPLLRDLRFIALAESITRLGRLEEALQTQSLRIDIAYVTHKLSSFPTLVSTSDFVAFMGCGYAKELARNWNIESHEMPGLGSLKQDIYLAHSKRSDNDPSITWLREQIVDGCQVERPEA